MQKFIKYFKKPLYAHIVFWVIIYLYFIFSVSNTGNFANMTHLLALYGLIVAGQIIVAYTLLEVLLPRFLNRKRYALFGLSLLLLLFIVFVLYNLVKVIWFDQLYYEMYSELYRNFADRPFTEKITDVPIIFSKFVLFLSPALLLMASKFYRDQQKYLKLSEQKKMAELSALKHQLNPHFLFNTLNNLYSLSLSKSDKAPEVIEKLSEILDYILYGAEANYVSIYKEVELIKNYLSLEEVRYGKRVNITFNTHLMREVNIAPLLLLTFIENAFKHGVSQELKQANIEINLSVEHEKILFNITNTKPSDVSKVYGHNKKCLGLNNVIQQLDLLYHNQEYELQIKDETNSYSVKLILKCK
ncbi:sensor histidine kinase [Fulvivirga sediminis]|uniref:Sensor histidine kinase n=1 Tax=Fulvivirga sediminis TaxID=2803949 RepID=A0A937JXD7_9BACT|nr:sensor histidine kinase [Fulvivirga sediminis]MBL3654519.1 sensor histidine kinase [Fulvivirga sediminis]